MYYVRTLKEVCETYVCVSVFFFPMGLLLRHSLFVKNEKSS